MGIQRFAYIMRIINKLVLTELGYRAVTPPAPCNYMYAHKFNFTFMITFFFWLNGWAEITVT